MYSTCRDTNYFQREKICPVEQGESGAGDLSQGGHAILSSCQLHASQGRQESRNLSWGIASTTLVWVRLCVVSPFVMHVRGPSPLWVAPPWAGGPKLHKDASRASYEEQVSKQHSSVAFASSSG